MSSIKSSASKQPAKQYVAAVPFNANFFSYTITTNPSTYVKTGTLAAIAGATATNCPAGRILRESGQKLYPGVHPNITTYMVGVIDSITFLTGYIDPNSPVFATHSANVPSFFANSIDPVGGLLDEGSAVYTNGIISAHGQIRCVGATGVRVTLNGTGTVTIPIDVSQGSFVYISGNGNNTLTCTNFNFGDRLFIQTVGTGNVTFSTGFGVATLTVAKADMMFSFICDGAHMLQTGASSWTNVPA